MAFEFDILSDMVTELSVVTESKDQDGNTVQISITDLVWVDRIYIYQEIWRKTLTDLYNKYLPGVQYESKWNGEITPYTLLQCKIADSLGLKKRFFHDKWTNSNTNLDELCKETTTYLKKIGIDLNALSPALNKCLPTDILEKQDVIYRLLSFPPLRELSLFYQKVHHKYTTGLNDLVPVFSAPETLTLPEFRVYEPYHKSVLYFDHDLFQRFNLDWAKSQQELTHRIEEIEKIKALAKEKEGKFSGKVVCACCGSIYETSVPVPVLEYKYLFEFDELAKDIGFLLLPNIEQHYLQNLAKSFNHIVQNLNNQEKALVLILVEGTSEVTGLPILAFKKRFSLHQNKVQVYNSGSKEQLLRDFKQFKNQFKHLKMVCLLDNDAKKEKVELEQMIKNNKNRYGLIFLEKGTWEDIFPLATSVSVLNQLYNVGDEITIEDFNPEKEFLKEVSRILWSKKKAQFDKVEFSRKICWGLEPQELPTVIDDIVTMVQKFLPVPGNIFKNG